MNVSTCIAVCAFLGFASSAAFAESPSSAAELAKTAQLNRDIAAANSAADAKYQAAESKYVQTKSQNDLQQQRYQDELKKNGLLRQQYEEKLRDYQNSYSSKS